MSDSNSTDALEATVDFGQTRDTLSFKSAQIAMLEERLLKQSVELASLQARDDERNSKSIESTQLSRCSTMPEDVRANIVDDSSKASNRNNFLFNFKGIGKMIKFDRSDSRNDELQVDFPAEGRRRTTEDKHPPFRGVHFPQEGRRRTTEDTHPSTTASAATNDLCEQRATMTKRKSRKLSLKVLRRQLQSSRKLGSSVLFPEDDDDYSLCID
mmetsp:Transcript_23968/g.39020  ORF Transcript_23968/g.39020 Transcript_23968/m.39020 type:complete len:213 (-) Transcript_23968:134-772(-)